MGEKPPHFVVFRECSGQTVAPTFFPEMYECGLHCTGSGESLSVVVGHTEIHVRSPSPSVHEKTESLCTITLRLPRPGPRQGHAQN
jgi:hypothetical protein